MSMDLEYRYDIVLSWSEPGGTNSMIEFDVPVSGDYGIRVNSLLKSYGRYTLSVQAL